ncbi:MAG: macrolide ABC transporter ATP-binding protein [Candidatus Melainabacteria bacterium]|nr:MAG: macrolide ABC transporter ATP-binding protein [Candidatus Melainabacteria bacterium]
MPNNVVELHDISRVYEMGEEPLYALKQLTLSIEDGDYVAIMGTSGSGKSTLMNLIGCLDRPTEGRYLLNHKDVFHLSDDELAAIRNTTIGFVFQQFNLLSSMTAIENVMLPLVYAGVDKEQRTIRAQFALQQVGLEQRMYHRPTQLSGGQQQRVSIARAIVNKPRILLADEPTGALDSHTAEEIMALFDDLVEQGITVILVTHDGEVANRASRIVRMRDGQITSDSRIRSKNEK